MTATKPSTTMLVVRVSFQLGQLTLRSSTRDRRRYSLNAAKRAIRPRSSPADWPDLLEAVAGAAFAWELASAASLCFLLMLASKLKRQKKWQARRDSNPQHAVLETAALPLELLACAMKHYFASR